MRRVLRFASPFLATLAILIPWAAPAAILQLTHAELSVRFEAFPGWELGASAAPLIGVSSGAGAFTLPADLLTGTVTVPSSLLTDISLISHLTLVLTGHAPIAVATGAAGGGHPPQVGIHRPGGGLGGEGLLHGAALLNIVGLFNLTIPLWIGENGAQRTATNGGMMIQVYGTGWTTGAVEVRGITATTPGTSLVNTVTFVGSDARTPGHAGQVLLVSPFKAVSGAFGNLPGVATLTLSFAVPEPGAIALLLAGAAGLAWMARARRRS
jgi:hypothetical protein